MRLMQVHRKSWKTDVAMLLTLVMLFSPILSGLDAAWLGVATKAAHSNLPQLLQLSNPFWSSHSKQQKVSQQTSLGE